MKKESPFACDMNAIAPEQRDAHLTLIERLFQSVESIRELPNGYKFQFSNESEGIAGRSGFHIL